MENQNNNLQELEQLRSQVAEFKNRLEQQEIVSERLLKQAMSGHVSWFKKLNVWADVVGLCLMPLVALFMREIGSSWAPFITLLVFLIGELIFNIWNTRSISSQHLMSNDVMTSRQRLLRFKQREQWQTVIEVPMIVLWLVWQYFDVAGSTSHNQTEMTVWFISVLVMGLAIGFYLYYREMRSLSKAIKDIDEFVNGK
ncbi:MAG: hypothetical protein IJ200_06180 [Prevotella sp.]|nr:hypothetical protein [Prevotella sp.]